MGTPQPRACTNERRFAASFSDFVREWDGTPFRVDMIHNFPDVGTEADVVELLDAVGLLADKIEDQLGYRILEMGDVIPVPEGMRPGWNEGRAEIPAHLPASAGPRTDPRLLHGRHEPRVAGG